MKACRCIQYIFYINSLVVFKIELDYNIKSKKDRRNIGKGSSSGNK